MKYQPVIGLEVHVELATQSKMFCGCPAEHFGKEPNSQTCPVCLGLPGALPVPNRKAVEWTIMLSLALGCKINRESHFDRKHYFYPDLPKGYQISQHEKPFGYNGGLRIKTTKSSRTIRIRDVHLEEDTGKLQHSGRETLIDFNRSGVPLVEIVTEPDFHSIEEVDVFLKKLPRVVRYLGISGADMEKGSMRIEPSISIKLVTQLPSNPIKDDQDLTINDQSTTDDRLPKYRVELKNINSFRFARKALEYEIKRQTEILERGEKVPQETRGWNEAKNATIPQREKEEARDYRYFPEPDIPPVRFAQNQIAKIKNQIPELPDEKLARFMKFYGLDEYQAGILTETREGAEYYEKCIKYYVLCIKGATGRERAGKMVANWIINRKLDRANVPPEELARQMAQAGQTAAVDEEELERVIKQVLAENPKAVGDYRKGKVQVLGFLTALVKKATGGDPKMIMNRIAKLIQ